MEPSMQFQDDVTGGVDMDSHAGNTEVSYGFGSFANSGFTSNHAAFMLVAVGVIGLWIISRVFRGA